MTFIEVLVSVVLLGTTVLGVLAGLQATIIGTKIERDHARAHQWLQSASEVLVNDIAFRDCDTGATTMSAAAIQAAYRADLRGNTSIVPANWTAPQIDVSVPVRFAGPSGAYGTTCHALIDRQLVVIQVEDIDGDIVETVEVVVVP